VGVRDTGIGIPKDKQEIIFNRFQTLDPSYTRRSDGTGLGLAICDKIVRAMGSEIELESKVGEGSFFYFDIGLDLAAETSCPPQKVQQPPATTSPARLNVLVAEDNPTNVYVVTEFLVDAEHIVHHAANGRIAVEMAQAEKYDIILMDISMPEMDGLQATSAIRSGEGPNRDTPIIALTAHTVSGDEKKFRGVGMTGYVSKPIRRDLLLQALTSQTTATPAIQRGAEVSGASSSPVLDLQDFKAFAVERKIERVLKTIEIFTAELRAKVAQLDAISEIHDTRALQDLAHSMIGSGCLLGAKQLVVISRSIEENCADSFEFPHDDARVLRHTLEKTSDKYAEIRTQAAVTSYIADGERAA
jgi:CheY-like chemotaxis protein/HPt (histidine-containing phosphotransfer) domain-containing protein